MKLNVIHYFIMKIPNKRELKQIASNHWPDTEFKNFMKLYNIILKNHFHFLVNDTTLPSDNAQKFRNNLL